MKILSRIPSLVLVALLIASTSCTEAPGKTKKQLGIATYSVKGLESNLEGAFESLQQNGYVVMEIANYNADEGTVAGYSPSDYAALAEKYGMDIISSHARAKFDVTDVEGTLAAWAKVFDDHKAMGTKYVVFPMNRWANNNEQMKLECDLMNKVGEAANKRGIKFGYHNHSREFENIPETDQRILDFLIANTNPENVFFQMDVFWVTVGGQDPVVYLKKYPNRFKVLHIKDDYVVGESGKIDYNAIFNQFYENGHEDWFMEMEEYMTEEQRAQMKARMEQMRNRQRESAQQGGEGARAGQDGERRRSFSRPQYTPEEEAERLKTALEGISLSAAYLRASDFVK
ncbi:MAG: hypothetical protein DRI70_08040 [Bacteroidetes bacterium]|nr:MAG: hypothetical protein DRI70_08040 [Bacteroidota bacterium]